MRALLLQSAPLPAPGAPARADHFARVDEALRARAIHADRALTDAPRPALPEGTRLVAVADCLGPMTRHALRLAREADLPTLLLMDGLVEHRNTFDNPRAGQGFLRPAPVHAVAAAGETCADVLAELGNEAWATGLPRLDAVRPDLRAASRPDAGPVLVATANTPFFHEAERAALLGALAAVRDAAARLGLPVAWRLTARLELALGVTNDARPLAEVLAGARAALTTPSTLLAECMLAGVPAGVIDAFGAPVWHTGAWVWRAHADGAVRALEHALPALVSADPALVRAQEGALDATHPGDGRSAERVADLIAELAHDPPRDDAPAVVPLTRPAPDRAPAPGRPRVVNLVWTDGAPHGGVPVWCARMAGAFADRPYDVVTLYLTPTGFEPGDDERGTAEVCVLPSDLGHAERLRVALDALLALEPAVVCAHYADLPHMVATAARFRGVRSVAVLQTDDADSAATVAFYDRFDAGVGVSDDCAARLRAVAGDRPVASIHDGVPIAPEPRTHGAGPLRLAYIGRMVELQKRVSDLAVLARELEARLVECELHLVGDGPDLDRLLGTLRAQRREHVRVVAHGQRPASWVRGLLDETDISVLVSDFEGASITMMEAMGAGVVACVTDVGSGVRDLVRDGVSGVVVPIGAMDLMAERIAALGADPARRGAIGRAGWEAARARASLDHACDRWQALLDEVMARDPVTTPTDVHLRPRDAWRWTRHWSDDPARDLAWAVDELRGAGYRRVVPCHPGEAPDGVADAVVLTGEVTPERAELAERLRASGLGVALAPTLVEPEWCRLARAVRRLADGGARRVAIYGAGDHTRRAARALTLGLPVVGIIDDRPGSAEMLGLPLVRTDDAIDALRPDAIVLSSDAWEPALWRRAERFRAVGLPVVALYGSYDAGSPAPR